VATIHWSVPIQFGSYGDEKAFFTWLESIGGVTRVEGRGTGLVIHLRSKRISKTALRELVAIYRRYGGEPGELAQFRPPKFKEKK
jgi:hypothetical protein